MIGQTLGHYRIVGKIGAGGMGEVYGARDERLERDVALKILPAGLLADEAVRKRFRKEALTLSRLNHPNIATVYDFDTEAGVDFLAMEHVPGETLAAKLRSGALREKDAVALALQVAEGLEEAHEHGIVHRDLKPQNIMVTPKGRVKVLDFGLAKLLRPVGGAITLETLGDTQRVAGTLPYMAPEQLQGEEVDARSDIFSLGAMLYEMVTGQRPFPEAIASRLTDAILHQPPVTPRALNPHVSPEVERIILKCLEKGAENRYQSAKELGVDLRRSAAPAVGIAAAPAKRARGGVRRAALVSGLGLFVLAAILGALNVGGWRDRILRRTTTPKIESLAVLPLENLSRDGAQDYFVDGMTEELTAEVSRIRLLRVISRTSAMRFRGTNKTMPQVSQELGADVLVEGSVLRSGNQVRITTQLIYGPTDTHLWAESYDRDLGDVINLQREVARDIARQIRIALTLEDQTRLANANPINSQAHELYLLGRYHLRGSTEGEINRAIVYFQQATEKDPAFARAYAGLADAYTALRSTYFAPQKVMPKAKAAAIKAIELDEGVAEGHVSLGGVLMFYDFDWAAAEREFRRAIELNPSLAAGHDYYATYLAAVGRPQEAVREIERALDLDPLSPLVIADAGWVYYLARDYDTAAEVSLKGIDLEPQFWPLYWNLGLAYEKKGKYQEAIVVLEKARQFDDSPTTLEMLGGAYAAAGLKDKANRVAAELVERSKHRYVCPYEVATIYAGLGKQEAALQWLRQAVDDRADCAPWMQADAKLDGMRSNPRFQDLLRRVGLRP